MVVFAWFLRFERAGGDYPRQISEFDKEAYFYFALADSNARASLGEGRFFT
jgi:hypothetical protein